eukprot:9064888-Pyramimonas_sp.AAC.2
MQWDASSLKVKGTSTAFKEGKVTALTAAPSGATFAIGTSEVFVAYTTWDITIALGNNTPSL